jgi:FixJ family two-component response regulator
VLGWKNKDAADHLGITEQDVANHKHFVVAKLRDAAMKLQFDEQRMVEIGLSE